MGGEIFNRPFDLLTFKQIKNADHPLKTGQTALPNLSSLAKAQMSRL